MKVCGRQTLFVVALLAALASDGFGQRHGRGFGRGSEIRPDMNVIHTMFAHRDKIERTVKMLPDGAEALTESADKEVAALLKKHVPKVEERVINNEPLPPMTFHPVFVGLLRHAAEYTLDYRETDRGVKVRYQAETPYAVMLVQEHAKLVSRFIQNGMQEIHAPYTLPKVVDDTATSKSTSVDYFYPRIAKYGKVARFPEAAQQPRSGSKILVDITKGSEPAKLNGAIEKVARFVNIYAGGGRNSADVKIAVVLHGDATLAVLTDKAYARKFDVNANPNLPCLQVLREAGVEFFVCGQSLVGKGSLPEDVSNHVAVAVSALSSIVNLQADGYAYLPMLK